MKYIILILGLFSFSFSKAQLFPNTQYLASATTLLNIRGGSYSSVGGIITNYTDTTTANLNSYIKNYAGASIFTTGDNTAWIRNSSKTAWIKQAAGTVTSDWALTGNTGTTAGTNFLGTTDNKDLVLKTNNIERIRTLASNGAVGIGTSTPDSLLTVIGGGFRLVNGSQGLNKVLVSAANGGASWQTLSPSISNAWGLTGNSGTVDGTNFIGTTDDVPFNIRVNNQKAGKIDNSNNATSFGYLALNALTSGTANTAFGTYSLQANTSGTGNTGVGLFSLGSNTSGTDNTAIGVSALGANTIGNHNTATGEFSLRFNVSGVNNTAFGFNTLNTITTGSSNTAIGYGSGNSITTGSGNTIIGANVGSLSAGLTNNVILADGTGNVRLRFISTGDLNIDVQSSITDTSSYKPLMQNSFGDVRKSSFWPVPTGAALTKSDDTNVTLTLGGSPSTSLLAATSLTLGWTGSLAATRGGTGTSTVTTGDILYGSASNVWSKLGVGSNGQVLTLASGIPSWATPTTGTVTSVTGTEPIQVATGTTTPVISMKKASATDSGWISTGTQTLAGAKTFSSALTFSTMTSGSVLFAGTSGLLSQDNANYFWDNTNKRLGIGTASPGYALDILSAAAGLTGFRVKATDGGSTTQIQNVLANDANFLAYYGISSTTFAGYAPIDGGKAFFGGYGNDVSIFTQSAKDIIFSTNGTEVARIKSGGNVGIGTVSPTAYLHIKAGTASASTAPLKFTSGTNLTTPEDGVIEYNGTDYFVTAQSARQTILKGTSGSFSQAVTATTTFTVTFGGTQPNATYKVNVTPTAALSAALLYVTNKTTTTFDVVFLAGLTGTVTFDWTLIQ